MTLLVKMLMAALDRLVRDKQVRGARIVYKQNARGEHVVAIVFPPQPP